MAHPWMMGHTGWLVVFVFIYGFRSGLCDISLTMEKTITGYKRDTVVIPCTYTASKDEEVTKIEWEFKNDPVIYRTDDQDHIPLVKYRNRVELSKSLPGDVSLTLRRLDTDDRGNFKCKVTGRDTSGKRIMQESVTILKVLRTRPPTEEPQVTTAEAEVTTKTLITTKPDVRDSTNGEKSFTEDSTDAHNEEVSTTKISHVLTGSFTTVNPVVKVSSVGKEPDFTTEYFSTETPDMETETTARRVLKTKILSTISPSVKVTNFGREADRSTENPVTEKPDMECEITVQQDDITRTSSEDDSAIARTKQPRKFHASSVPAYPFTSNVVNDNAPAEAIKSSGIFFYMLIIGLLCIASVLILAIVLIARRKRKSFDYNIPTMNQLALNLEGHSSEPASNNYEPAFPVSQYESLPMCSNIYEKLVLKNLEGNDSKSQTSQ